jgi:23S rRNA (pseudouridine1915-N3)-methyltransferase
MRGIQLICVGKLKESYFQEAASEYLKRLGPYCRITVDEVAEQRLPDRPSPAEIEAALAREAETILSRLPKNGAVIALCVEGKEYDSEAFASMLSSLAGRGVSRLAFVIGGSFGLHSSVKERADHCLSLSPRTFPHHLARIMLLEQLYRTFQILGGTQYHK